MSTICAEHKFQLQPSHQLLSLKKSLRDLDIPPRKLLTRRSAADMFSDDILLQKYLHHTKSMDSDDSDDVGDPYSSDEFRMFEFKVRRCTRSRSHDWTDCPFAHPGEKARRRDPRRFHYSGTVCPEYRRGQCSSGDACEFSHGVFECWLHPSRYRTEACKDGKNCKRKVCFFAHTPRQLRVLPPQDSNKKKKCSNMMSPHNNHNNNNNNSNHCCLFCHCSSTCSPTSTLFGMSHFSPPLSPSSSSSEPGHRHGVVSYKDVLSELMCSMEALNFGEASSVSASKPHTLSWLDVSEDHKQFNVHSPTMATCQSFSMNRNGRFFREESGGVVDDVIAPDLAWVNDLLM
ncbi:zinc finger CCCH domain-containing protein 2 [Vigna radiata var. radiata]|uniref:Zinc finger CCCH domain-containing protein 2 n=1 Tax=Vigna radiata var. radiata TaxID=3916 RepID=A0A1S3TIQ4_VIGRR|nr:zinc finger CCCH domain-containing protein 2 [Vigna radiata var. radiata]